MSKNSSGWTFSVLRSDGHEELLLTCDCFDDFSAMSDWLRYTKPLACEDQVIVVRQKIDGLLVSQFSTCGLRP